ncbi:MAG: chromate resistance protein ChrB domain-containing protein, partial [Pyrinomonadaceae bacterium]
MIANDFFNAKGRATATAAYERARKAVHVVHPSAARAPASSRRDATLHTSNYQGRRWVTRRNLHIDRLASAWLIKQFVDKRPRFYFVAEGESVEGAIPFDMFNADFTHHGDDCT